MTRTVDGRAVQIIDPGRLNTDAGPDFFNAKIAIDGRVWAGDVEIHVRASDWHRHGHDTDPAYKGADSRRLLRRVVELIGEKGFVPANVDVTVIAQRPKLLPYIPDMIRTVAEDLGIDPERVSVKATTTEHLGFTGRGEGIAAQASALIVRRQG